MPVSCFKHHIHSSLIDTVAKANVPYRFWLEVDVTHGSVISHAWLKAASTVYAVRKAGKAGAAKMMHTISLSQVQGLIKDGPAAAD